MYLHEEHQREHLTLHDCRAGHVAFQDGNLIFSLADGFWIAADHPDNPTHQTVRTDRAEVRFLLSDTADFTAYVYSSRRKKTVREAWTLEQLIAQINRGAALELLYDFRDGEAHIMECMLSSAKRPYWKECDLKFSAVSEVYCWNRLREDCIW